MSNFQRRRPRKKKTNQWSTPPGVVAAATFPSASEALPPNFHGGKRRRPERPWIIESRLLRGLFSRKDRKWRVHGRYRNERERAEAFRQLQHTHKPRTPTMKPWIVFRLADPPIAKHTEADRLQKAREGG